MVVECPGCRSRYDVTGRPAGTRARCRCGTTFALPRPPETAAALACPQCGAACPPDRHQCAFCGTVLAVVACPRCFGLLFNGARHCQHCGAAVDVPARAAPEGGATALACPRCAAGGGPTLPLVARLVGDTLLDECAACGGVWVDVAALERAIAERERQAALAAAGGAAPPGVAGPEKVVYLRCPECGVLMRRMNFGRRSGVIIDVCRPHGTWFDRDEMRRVMEFVASGGLEGAHRAEVEDLRREAQAQKARIRQLGMSGGGAGGVEAQTGGLELLLHALSWLLPF